MKVSVILIDEGDKRWGWAVKGKGIEGGGKRTAATEKEAEQQAKEFVGILVKTEKINLATSTVKISVGSRVT